jgi:hypothetical protein
MQSFMKERGGRSDGSTRGFIALSEFLPPLMREGKDGGATRKSID